MYLKVCYSTTHIPNLRQIEEGHVQTSGEVIWNDPYA